MNWIFIIITIIVTTLCLNLHNINLFCFCLVYLCFSLFLFIYFVCEAIGTAATPGLLCQPRVIVKMIVEKQMECRLARETEVLGENVPQRHFCPSQNPTWPDSGLKPGRRGGKPATNRLNYDAAFVYLRFPLDIQQLNLSRHYATRERKNIHTFILLTINFSIWRTIIKHD
jgi:hypothetical protein